MSQNRPIYKSTSTKTIAETIKFSNLSHINPIVNLNLEGFQTNLHTTKITIIQHNISYVTTFRRRSQIDYIITESSLLQNKSCKTCGSKQFNSHTEFKYTYWFDDHGLQKHSDKRTEIMPMIQSSSPAGWRQYLQNP